MTRDLGFNMRASIERQIRTTEHTAFALTKNYRTALADIREKLAVLYEKYSVDGKLTYAQMTKFNRLKKLNKQISEILGETNKENIALIEKLTKTNYDDAFFRTGWAVDQATGVNVSWGLLSPDVVTASVANDLRFISEKRLKNNSLTKIQSAVSSGLTQGTSYGGMAAILKDSINGTIKDAMRIARTEGARATTIGSQFALDRALNKGVDVVQVWDATLDSRTRLRHGEMDGKPMNMEQKAFWFRGRWVPGPQQTGIPGEDINCRCGVTGRIEGLEPSLRRVNGEVVPWTNYHDWRQNMRKNGGKYKPSETVEMPEAIANYHRNIERRKNNGEKTAYPV